MARTLTEILEHADELAGRFENDDFGEPSPTAMAAHKLRVAAIARAEAERNVHEAVRAAREAEVSWKRIGDELGTSAQAAQSKYSQGVAITGHTAVRRNVSGGRVASKSALSTKTAKPERTTKSGAAKHDPKVKRDRTRAARAKRG